MTRVIVAGKYQLLKKIGEGSFGKIYSARGVTPLTPPSGERADAECGRKGQMQRADAKGRCKWRMLLADALGGCCWRML